MKSETTVEVCMNVKLKLIVGVSGPAKSQEKVLTIPLIPGMFLDVSINASKVFLV